ncbi:MAG: histidine kinase N-terminal 7TM domain-containing protein [Oscillospiraceae bacterium]|jgi:two-component system sensor histidine kinase HupT/HoxJ
MISDLFAIFTIIALFCIIIFISWSIKTQHLRLIHKLYISFAVCYSIWILALFIMKFVDPQNITVLFVLDALTNSTGAFTPTLYFCISLTFLNNWEKLPTKAYFLFFIPVFSSLVVWTNPFHHLQYQVFSIFRSEVVFGPYMLISGAYSYLCIVAAIVLMIRFAIRNRAKLYVLQCLLFSLGGLCPLIVSIVSTFFSTFPITATPLSFASIIVFNGIAIYKLHLLDIKPLATQLVLDSISDSYAILSDNGLVISFNKPFSDIFSPRYGLKEGSHLEAFQPGDDNASNAVIYNLIAAVNACKTSLTTISYEQPIITREEKSVYKAYYIAEVSPALLDGQISGYIVIFKDVTQLKNSMQTLQDNQARMMEQERLAFLGQMMGGLAHNLKTPIMSISGCISSAATLIEECRDSLDDPDVTTADYLEIYDEIEGWFQKMREASAYMSDIITAIKGQASTVAANKDAVFTIEELFKRVTLLMRHELLSSHNHLTVEYNDERGTAIRGDINTLIQVLDNFISNSIYAQPDKGKITLGVYREDEYLKIYVKDNGFGVKPHIKNRLFREMVTSKGTHGTGLGLYISQVVVHGNFGGDLWYKENPEGGSIFGMSIPAEHIIVSEYT